MDDAGNWVKKKPNVPPDREIDPTKGRRQDDEERPLDEDTEGDVDPTKRKPVEPGTRET